MEKYKLLKNIEAERMTQDEFEKRTGIKVRNLVYGTEGYLVKEKGEPEEWVPNERIEPFIVRCGNLIDMLRYRITQADDILAWMNEYSRRGRIDGKTMNYVVRCKEHLKSCKHELSEILFLNLQKL